MSKKITLVTLMMVIYLAVFAIMIAAGGCATKPTPNIPIPVQPIPVQPIQNLTKIITQTNWLMVVALGMFTWGVMSIFSGNTKGGVFVAGSLALAGGIAALTVGNELLIAWLPFLKWAIPAGAIAALAFYIYNHNIRTAKIVDLKSKYKAAVELLDTDKDGKISTEELKAVLGLALPEWKNATDIDTSTK
jgi:hypothetical protein